MSSEMHGKIMIIGITVGSNCRTSPTASHTESSLVPSVRGVGGAPYADPTTSTGLLSLPKKRMSSEYSGNNLKISSDMIGNVLGNDWTYSRTYFGNVLENDWKCPRICARICPRHVAVETPKTSAPELVDNMRPRKPRTPRPRNVHLRAYYAPLTRLLRAGRRHPDPGKTRVGIQDTWLPIGLLQVQLHFVLHAFILHHWPWQHQCCQLLLDSCSHVDIWWCLRVRDLRLPCSRISLGYS